MSLIHGHRPAVELDEGAHLFAHLRVGHPDAGHVGDGRVLDQDLFEISPHHSIMARLTSIGHGAPVWTTSSIDETS